MKGGAPSTSEMTYKVPLLSCLRRRRAHVGPRQRADRRRVVELVGTGVLGGAAVLPVDVLGDTVDRAGAGPDRGAHGAEPEQGAGTARELRVGGLEAVRRHRATVRAGQDVAGESQGTAVAGDGAAAPADDDVVVEGHAGRGELLVTSVPDNPAAAADQRVEGDQTVVGGLVVARTVLVVLDLAAADLYRQSGAALD